MFTDTAQRQAYARCSMALEPGAEERIPADAQNKSKWGSKLFFATLFAALIFFWWLLIYTGGAGKHG